MSSIRNGLRTWLDAVAGMTAPVDINATPQNRQPPFVQVQSTSLVDLDLGGDKQETFDVRCYAMTADAAQDNANTLRTALDAVQNVTMTGRVAMCVFIDDQIDDVVRDDAGKEVGLHISSLSVRVMHKAAS